MKHLVTALLILLMIGTNLTGCRPTNKDVPISERPAESTDRVPIPDSASSLALHLTIPFSVISSKLDGAFPKSIRIADRKDVCTNEQVSVRRAVEGLILGDIFRVFTETVRVCTPADYDATITRDAGPISVSRAKSGIHIGVPIRVQGWAGFTGDIARIVGMNRKNFRATLIAYADVNMDIDDKWCPKLTVSPGFEWINRAELEVAGRFWIPIDGQLNDKIKKAMNEVAAEIPKQFTCSQLQGIVSAYWQTNAIPVPASDGIPESHVLITPKAIAFSGLDYSDTGVELAWQLDSEISVRSGSTKTSDTSNSKKALPPLARIKSSTNSIHLTVPIRLDYKSIEIAITNALGKQPYQGSSPLGPVNVSVHGIEIYPSMDRLVIGVNFSAKAENAGALDTTGTLYLLGKPTLDVSTQTLSITDVTFSRILNNDIWNAVSAIFRSQIVESIEKKAIFHLEPAIRDGRRNFVRSLDQAARAQGITVSFRDDFLGLKTINLSDTALEVLVGLEGTADVLMIKEPIQEKLSKISRVSLSTRIIAVSKPSLDANQDEYQLTILLPPKASAEDAQ